MTDPFEILSRYDVVDNAEIDAYSADHAERIKSEIMRTPRLLKDESSSQPRRLRRVVAVAASVAVLAAAAFVATRSPETAELLACHSETDLDSDRIGIRAPEALDESACIEVWESGSLTNPTVPVGEVPPLTACVNDSGAVVVFPTADAAACSSLGLTTLDDDPSTSLDSVLELQNQLITFFASSSCTTFEDAHNAIESALSGLGMDDWSVEMMAANPDRPCASFGIDAAAMSVIITPVPQG